MCGNENVEKCCDMGHITRTPMHFGIESLLGGLRICNCIFTWIPTQQFFYGKNELHEPVVNHINYKILLGKYYIQICRCKNMAKCIDNYEYLLECKNEKLIKYEIMTTNDKCDTFMKEWGELYQCLI